MIRINKNYQQRPARIDFHRSDKIREKIREALKEQNDHDASNNYYRGDNEKPGHVIYELFDLYHYKCGFCETHLKSCESALAVEHYRPRNTYKAKANQDPDPEIHHNGYYWLSYEWSNLLLACTTCNGGKGSKFPIKGARVTGPEVPDDFTEPGDLEVFTADQSNYEHEQPLIINPERDDPNLHFDFTRTGEMLLKSNEAKVTERLCKLNRRLLRASRKDLFDNLILRLKEAAVLATLTTIENPTMSTKLIYKMAFDQLFNEISRFGKPEQGFSAFLKWIKLGFIIHVKAALKPEAFQVVELAWEAHQNGWG